MAIILRFYIPVLLSIIFASFNFSLSRQLMVAFPEHISLKILKPQTNNSNELIGFQTIKKFVIS